MRHFTSSNWIVVVLVFSFVVLIFYMLFVPTKNCSVSQQHHYVLAHTGKYRTRAAISGLLFISSNLKTNNDALINYRANSGLAFECFPPSAHTDVAHLWDKQRHVHPDLHTHTHTHTLFFIVTHTHTHARAHTHTQTHTHKHRNGIWSAILLYVTDRLACMHTHMQGSTRPGVHSHEGSWWQTSRRSWSMHDKW